MKEEKSKMSLSESTPIVLNFKTIGTMAAAVAVLVGGYYSLQQDLEKAMNSPRPEITRVEFDLKSETTNGIVKETQSHIKDGHTTLYLMLLEQFDRIDKHIYELEAKIK